ncbi:MAG: glycoside hydrolase family 2 [Paludibacter sp.]|nr:glycoside hydrolase family 2 [Paludibacter sp.]
MMRNTNKNHAKYQLFQIKILFVVLLIPCVTVLAKERNQSVIPLNGIWMFKTDPMGMGLQSNGLQMFTSITETITLPGSTDEAGKGLRTQSISSIRLTRTNEYKGPAWYEKEVFVPLEWKDKEVKLFLERVHWESKLWVNGKYAGSDESLSVPHVYPIEQLLKFGEKNNIRLRVNNELIYDIQYSHAISAETQTNWNGIVGKIELQAENKVSITDVQIFPDVTNKKIKLDIMISNADKALLKGKLLLNATTKDGSIKVAVKEVQISSNDSLPTISVDYPMGNIIKTWDEFSPDLYQLNVQLFNDAEVSDSKTYDFGMREVGTKNTRFTLNGKEIFIRGTVNSAEFPLTGYPPTDKKGWEKVLVTCKDYGLNLVRFHSWCPPEAAFEVADSIGIYLQIENSDWRFNVGEHAATDDFLRRESLRILKTYGNHPSFLFFCEGNELVGKGVKEYLSGLINMWKEDTRHLYTGSAAYPYISENQYNVLYGARPHRWKEGLKSKFNAAPLNTLYDYSDYVKKYSVPMITHEIGQWCVYPDFNEIPKYTGVLKPYNYQIFRESLRDHHMLELADNFTSASGKFHLILKKEEFESYYRTPGMAGYHLLQLNDFPGQGTAPVGVVDVFYNPKTYVTAKEFSAMQSPCLPLLVTSSFVWTNNQEFTAEIRMVNFSQHLLKKKQVSWILQHANGKVYKQGSFAARDLPRSGPYSIGSLKVSLKDITKAEQLKLIVRVAGTEYQNKWDLWVYPQHLPQITESADVRIADSWNPEVKEKLKRGETVLLLADTASVKHTVSSCFSGISWNAVWSGMPPELLGIFCNPAHPLFAYFPTEYHSNWQWWDLVIPSRLMNLDQMPPSFFPLLQMIPDWNKNSKLGLVIEAKVGNGKLLICSIDLKTNMEKRPVARQFLYSLKNYVNSPQFDPKDVLSETMIDQLFVKNNVN